MPNLIKLPIINSGSSNLVPRFTCLSAEDVYSVTKSSVTGVIHVHYALVALGGTAPTYLRASIDYTNGTEAIADQDIENLKNLIASANQNPSSTPEFALIGARDATNSTITDYQVVDIQIKAEVPYAD